MSEPFLPGSARARLSQLFDEGCFQELFRFASEHPHREQPPQEPPHDAIVCAHGDINGQPAVAYATEATIQGGSVGALQARQIIECQRLAQQSGIPIVALLESGGARISEAAQIMEGYAGAMASAIGLSGVVPQVACVFGPCIGASAFMATLSDWVIMEQSASLSLAGARVNAQATGEVLSETELGGVDVHQQYTGNIHFVAQGESAVLAKARALLKWLPSHYRTRSPIAAFESLSLKEQKRKTPEIEALLPLAPQTPFDMRAVINACADHGDFFETQAHFAPNIVTGFLKVGGYPLAVVANQSLHMGGALDAPAARKVTRFLNTVNAFNFAVLSLVDVPGALPTLAAQQAGILTAMSQSMHAIYNIRGLRLTVIVRRCFGGAYAMAHPKSGKGDLIFAYPNAMIGVMDDAAMKKVMQHSPTGKVQIEALKRQGLRSDDPYLAAAQGYIDDVINPADTRQVLYRSLKSFYHKRVTDYAPKLHGNPPQ